MAEISASQVMALRQKTGVSMMECKKALAASGGDAEKAVDFLRKEGVMKASNKSDRVTAEGVVAISGNAIVSIRCETDFVARNDDFVNFVQEIADIAAKDGEAVAREKFEERKAELFTKLGENIVLGEIKILSGETFGGYVHSNRKVAALVGLSRGNREIAADIAMHATAMNPQVLSPTEVSDELVAKEKEIWKDQLAKEGKPEQVMAKIMEGKERKFREESALLKQPFVKDQEKNVEEFARAQNAEVKSFARLSV